MKLTKSKKEILRQAAEILEESAKYSPDVSFTSPSSVRNYLLTRFAGLEREVFVAMWLDSQHRLIEVDELFKGTIDSAAVYPREIVKRALEHNAAAVIIAHNHPSGIAEPSQSDILITERIEKALDVIDVKVFDHMVAGNGIVISFAERGLL
jgi:DNA repair protein RadC